MGVPEKDLVPISPPRGTAPHIWIRPFVLILVFSLYTAQRIVFNSECAIGHGRGGVPGPARQSALVVRGLARRGEGSPDAVAGFAGPSGSNRPTMPQTCRQCARLNPDEAAFCYYEGRPLGKPGAPARRIVSCLAPFFAPFVFPSGRSCRNFDQLAQGCLEEWDSAIEMLRRGYLESFFARIERPDLATAARAAAHDHDVQRGLDHLLELLPTSNEVLPPRLRLASLEINLGPMRVGEDRKLDLALTNGGMRLLYGTVVSGALWLCFLNDTTTTEKSF